MLIPLFVYLAVTVVVPVVNGVALDGAFAEHTLEVAAVAVLVALAFRLLPSSWRRGW